MNLERTKPETLAAGVMDYMPQSLAAHEYAERLNAALARLGLTERLTLPPAPNTAIDELPAVVDVPLRKTLSVLMGKAQQGDASALATLEWTAQVAESIFAGLHARASVYPLALPSHESLATLSQGVDALLPRKISNGAWSLLADGTLSDGIQDGVSLVRLLCSSAADSVTELKDDNEGWVMTRRFSAKTYFPNCEKMELGCEDIDVTFDYNGGTVFGSDVEYHLPNLKVIHPETISVGFGHGMFDVSISHDIYLPELEEIVGGSNFGLIRGINSDTNTNPYSVYAPNLKRLGSGVCIFRRYNACRTGVERLVLGNIATAFVLCADYDMSLPNLIHLEFGQGTSASLNLAGWNPTSVLSDSAKLPIFLSNFKTYIAERLSEQGSGLTLTLSQAVRDAIEGDPTIAQIITSKGWTISPAPTA